MCVTHYVYGGAYIYLLWQSIKKSNNQNRRIYVWCTSLLNDISREQFRYLCKRDPETRLNIQGCHAVFKILLPNRINDVRLK